MDPATHFKNGAILEVAYVRGGSGGWQGLARIPANTSFRPQNARFDVLRAGRWPSIALETGLINAQTRTTATKHTPTTHKNGSQALNTPAKQAYPRKSMQAERKSLNAVVTRTNLGHDVPKPRLTNENIEENRVAHHDRRERLACEAQASNIAFYPSRVKYL